MSQHRAIEIGIQVYAAEGGETFGAVRGYVHDGMVVGDVGRLDARVREAIARAHDRAASGA